MIQKRLRVALLMTAGVIFAGWMPAAEGKAEKAAPPPTPASPAANDPEALFRKGQDLYRKGQNAQEGRAPESAAEPSLRGAAASFEDLIRRFPDAPRAADASLLLGTTHLLLDDMEKALAMYRRTYDSYPTFKDRGLALLRIGVCEAGLDRPAEARSTFEKFLREHSDRKAEREKVAKYLRELGIVGLKAPPLSPASWLHGLVSSEGLKEFEGQVVVVVWFATWCPNCRKELPHLRALMKKWASKDVVFLGSANPDDPQATMPVDSYARTNKLEFFDVALDRGARSWAPYRVSGFPAAAIIDRKGTVRWRGHPSFFPNPLVEKALGEREKP
jgi:thiol-disulfide isomerase/thioredoxin